MLRLNQADEYKTWVHNQDNIKRAFNRKFGGKFLWLSDIAEVRLWHDWGKTKSKKKNAAMNAKFDKRGDMILGQFFCPVFVVRNQHEALYVWDQMCVSRSVMKVYRDNDRVLLRVKDFVYLIPCKALVNTFWFKVEAGKYLVKNILWDLINRTADVQDYVDHRNEREVAREESQESEFESAVKKI